MRVVLTLSPTCKRAVDRLERRYPSVRKELALFAQVAPYQAPSHPILCQVGSVFVRKGRAPNRDAKRGKSYGFRIIYAIGRRETDGDDACRLIAFYVYDKTEQNDVTDADLDRLISEMRDDLGDMGTVR